MKMNKLKIRLAKLKGVDFCSVCKKKPAKYIMGRNSAVTKMLFCSKTCIANRTIKHYKIEELK